MNAFDAMYDGTPPWEIGRPQPAFQHLLERGLVRGRVLDVGCGTGENALCFAAAGLTVVGIDIADKAVRRAQNKARARDLSVGFHTHDALALDAAWAEAVGGRFDTVVDCGLFHAFTDHGREAYRRALASVMRTGSELFVLCFSDSEPDWGGPRRVTADELRATFGPPFAVDSVRPARFEHLLHSGAAHALLARVVHVGAVLSRNN